jgi:hypothetical protein
MVIEEEERRVFMNADAKLIEGHNLDFLHFLSEKSGFHDNPLPLREIRYVFDPLYCMVLSLF